MPPTDCSSASLFDTAYVHPVLEKSPLLWIWYHFFNKYSVWSISGTTAGLDQWVGGIPERDFHASKGMSSRILKCGNRPSSGLNMYLVIPNKSNNAMPYISEQYRPRSKTKFEEKRSQYLSVPPVDLRGRRIDLAPWPEYFDEQGVVHFQDSGRPEAERMKGATVKPDIVILATGYKQLFPFLDKGSPDEADIRRVWVSGEESIGFIGFVRPNLGRRI